MINLSLNECQYETTDFLSQTIKSFDLSLISRYSKNSPLREALATKYNLSENAVYIEAGGEICIKNIFQQIAILGNYKVLIPESSWHLYRTLMNHYQLDWEEVECIKKGNSFDLNWNALKDKIDKYPRCLLLLNLPSNPLGFTLSRQTLELLAVSLTDEQILFVDESYYGFHMENIENDICYDLGSMNNTIVVRTFSKYFGLAGLRIGYTIVSENLNKSLKLYQSYLGNNAISEHFSVECLKASSYFKKISNTIIQEREYLYDFFKELDGFSPFLSSSNFLLVEVLDNMKDSYINFLQENGILIRSMQDSLIKNCVRITIGTPEQNDLVKQYSKDFAELKRNESVEQLSI